MLTLRHDPSFCQSFLSPAGYVVMLFGWQVEFDGENSLFPISISMLQYFSAMSLMRKQWHPAAPTMSTLRAIIIWWKYNAHVCFCFVFFRWVWSCCWSEGKISQIFCCIFYGSDGCYFVVFLLNMFKIGSDAQYFVCLR